MLDQIKNSLLCKCLQTLLIGYFLMSSSTISNSFGQIISDNAGTHSIKGITCYFLNKIFKCDEIPEERDDYETKETKTEKTAKGILLLDYLVSLNDSLSVLYFEIRLKGENYIDNSVFSSAFYEKIHLPPPRAII